MPGWAGGKVLNRLEHQPTVVPQLTLFQTAVEAVSAAMTLCRQHSLRTNDALILAVMQPHHLTHLAHLASHDTDFNRVPGITRYAPA